MAKVFNLILAFLVALSIDGATSVPLNSSSLNTTDDGKIVGGYTTYIKDAPYQVYLRLQKGSKYYKCGGSIISVRYVLTAAHCLDGISRVFIRIGSSDSQSGGTEHSTNNFKMHPQYNSRTKDFDVGVIRLNENMRLDGKNTKAVKLPKAGAGVGTNTELLVTGWGDTSESGSGSRYLRAVKVPTMSEKDCKKAYSWLTGRMICAGVKKGGKDACQGDSGGPAVHKGEQLGITSFGRGCARKDYPGVYTKVSAVRQWIKTNAGV